MEQIEPEYDDAQPQTPDAAPLAQQPPPAAAAPPPPQPPPPQPPAPAAPAAVDIFGAPAVVPAPAPAAAAPSGGGLDLDDLFGGPVAPAPVVPANPLLAQLAPLTPAQLPTAQFGAQWGQLPSELSVSIPAIAPSPQGVSAKLAPVKIGLVQVIGTEFIAGAAHASGLVLCHFACAPAAVNVKVRTANAQLTQGVVALLQQTVL